jgi:maltooligosyltrehalose trehalohydrolase
VNEFKIDLPGEEWKIIIDSAEEEWLGPGSTLPQKIYRSQKFSMRPFGFALYEKVH